MADNTPTIADPGPLGLAAFALTTFMLSIFNAGILNAKLTAVVLPLALIYGGVAQLLAGMWEFKRNNVFGAVAFTSYGAFWIAFFYYVKYVAGGLPASDANKATGLFLLAWLIFSVLMFVASFGTNGILVAIFGLLVITFGFLTIGAFGNSAGATKIGGYFGIILALAAWYAAMANIANTTFGKPVFPLFPFKK
ncbi:acetate uptake transporter [Acidithrix ferrooxidans]|uniref:Succinate-acetate/proton symporter SatP n=2 Tax=root TaxID=1 RepID=A0A0D8HHE3_9ACTN|nr:GPR1/FUN34/YaaH family transporter [Acidithrix ferrooxidans]KJF16486.1 succinate-acetate/proton symporter SatP [Acidithrix ferrooxidans]